MAELDFRTRLGVAAGRGLLIPPLVFYSADLPPPPRNPARPPTRLTLLSCILRLVYSPWIYTTNLLTTQPFALLFPFPTPPPQSLSLALFPRPEITRREFMSLLESPPGVGARESASVPFRGDTTKRFALRERGVGVFALGLIDSSYRGLSPLENRLQTAHSLGGSSGRGSGVSMNFPSCWEEVGRCDRSCFGGWLSLPYAIDTMLERWIHVNVFFD